MGTERIFINYRRDDSRADSGRIYDYLNARFPGRVFRDISSSELEPGDDWHKAIGRAVSQADACIVVIGCKWLDIRGEDGQRRLDDSNDTVRQEIFAALERQVRVIPVLVGGARMPRRQDLPVDLQPLCDRQALEMTDPGWSESCAKLDRAIEIAAGPAASQFAVEKKSPPSSAARWLMVFGATAVVLIALATLVATTNRNHVVPSTYPVIPNSVTTGPSPAVPVPVVAPMDPAGNWVAQENINGAFLSSNLQLYPDHSFRNVVNGLTTAVGGWQANAAAGFDLTNGTTLSTGVHFSCNSGSGGNSLQGTCSDRLGNAWNFTAARVGGQVQAPTAPPRVDVSRVSMAELQFLNERLSRQLCTCRCGMTVAMCLQRDPTCQYSPRIGSDEVARLTQTTR